MASGSRLALRVLQGLGRWGRLWWVPLVASETSAVLMQACSLLILSRSVCVFLYVLTFLLAPQSGVRVQM